MTRRQKAPLRPLTALEQQTLERIGRSHTAAATPVARAKALLAVAAGHSYTTAARLAGRRSGDAVAHLVARFNHESLSALEPRHGGGPPPRYGTPQRERILREVQRVPDREQDRTATWSLLTRRTALRKAPDGLPTVSTYTLWHVLREAGWTWQRSRTWCETGQVLRKRKHLWTIVQDRDAAAKKAHRTCLSPGAAAGDAGLVYRSSWTVPNDALSGAKLAAASARSTAAPDLLAQWHG